MTAPHTEVPGAAAPVNPANSGLLARFHDVVADPDQFAHQYRENGQALSVPQLQRFN